MELAILLSTIHRQSRLHLTLQLLLPDTLLPLHL
jgi:hypothetical protein